MNRRILNLAIAGLILILLINLSPIWERHPGGFWIPVFFLLIVALIIWVIIQFFKELIKFFKKKLWSNFMSCIPLLISILIILLLFLVPTINIDKLYGEVTFRACYEGTQNTATFKLRVNNRFETHYTGVFFYDKYYTGNFEKHGDTLLLIYNRDIDSRLGNKVLMIDKDSLLLPLYDSAESKRRLGFYYGYCKGLN